MAALEEHGNMRIHVYLMPESFIKQCELDETKDKDGHVCTEIHGDMCGFLQAGTLAHTDLVKRLAAYGYEPTNFTPGLWTHQSNIISFILAVDDFGAKHSSMSSLNHLFNVLKKLCCYHQHER